PFLIFLFEFLYVLAFDSGSLSLECILYSRVIAAHRHDRQVVRYAPHGFLSGVQLVFIDSNESGHF
ncbi:hypothetical protein, partial [Shewanella algae]|uniref:hypothetical protein n=1 Tax=Shewanella algae TaxID=38313 RepID=UPI00313BF82C